MHTNYNINQQQITTTNKQMTKDVYTFNGLSTIKFNKLYNIEKQLFFRFELFLAITDAIHDLGRIEMLLV